MSIVELLVIIVLVTGIIMTMASQKKDINQLRAELAELRAKIGDKE